MRIVLVFLLFLCGVPCNGAHGGERVCRGYGMIGSHRAIAVEDEGDARKGKWLVKDVLRYCRQKGGIQTDNADTERSKGIHTYMICPLLAELLHALSGCERPEAERLAHSIGYSATRYYLTATMPPADPAGNTASWATVDVLSFHGHNPLLDRCMEALEKKECLAVGIGMKAPEQCLVFCKGEKTVAVWCSVFCDGWETVQRVREELDAQIGTQEGCRKPCRRNTDNKQ